MLTYDVTFFIESGAVFSRQFLFSHSDDDVTDQVGGIAHSHAIRITQADRVVIDFPPLCDVFLKLTGNTPMKKFLSIQWSEELAIDDGVIDQDHQTLIAILNEFLDPAPTDSLLARSQTALDKLHQHALAHFSREEALQAQVRFPGLDAHHQEHLEMGRQLAGFREQLAWIAGPRDGSEGRSPTRGLSAICGPNERAGEIAAICDHVGVFIRDWLIDHVVRSDLQMKPYVAKMAHYACQLSPLEQAVAESADGLRIEEPSGRSLVGS
jgi:hemerythrin